MRKHKIHDKDKGQDEEAENLWLWLDFKKKIDTIFSFFYNASCEMALESGKLAVVKSIR